MKELTAQHMKEYVANNPTLVQKKNTSKKGIYVLKYKNRVFYKNLWTDELREMRGTLIDEDYNIISIPFRKIFNRGERKTDIDRDEMVVASQKINGFMACATWHNKELLVSTTGTIDSDFAKLAYKWIEPYWRVMDQYNGLSFCFEIVDPSDPHIIAEEAGVYLLNVRMKNWNAETHYFAQNTLDNIASLSGLKRPKWEYGRFGDFVNEVKTVQHEGFAIYSVEDSNIELKMKSPKYLVSKFLGRVNLDKLEKILDNDTESKKNMDEDFYPVIDYIGETFGEFKTLERQQRIEYVRTFIEGNIL